MSQLEQQAIKQKTSAISLERVMEVWCCFFLAAGLLNAIYKLPAMEPAIPGAFIYYPALFVLPIFFFNRRLIALVTLSATAVVLFSALNEYLWLKVALDFIRWWAAGYVPVNIDYIYYYYVVVPLLLAGAVCLGLGLLIRLRLPVWLLFIVCPATVIGLAYLGLRGFVVSIYLMAAGLLPLTAASTVNRTSQARGRAAAYALALTAVILGTVFLVMPIDTGAWRWQSFGDKVEEWRESARVVYWGWRTRNEPLASFDLTDEYHAHLGGPINPGKTRMMTVKASEPLLLKGSVYDCYTGYGWMKSESYNKMFYGLANNGDDEYFTISENAIPFTPEITDNALKEILGTIPQPESDHPLAPFARRFSVEITLLHPEEPRLFYGGRPQNFSSADEIEPFLEHTTELKSRLPLYNGYRYELSGLTLDRTMAGFATAVTESSHRSDMPENWLFTAQGDFSFQLPHELLLDNDFADCYTLLQEIVHEGLEEGERRSSYEQALLLERWLKDNCRYTLTPEMPPETADFVLHFLKTREGYCTYYATAMVVMARLLNIRARYVTGYLLSPLRAENQYEATQATAHAWAELFFDGVGWLPFDATGQSAYAVESMSYSASQTEYDPFEREYARGAGPTGLATNYRFQWPIILALVLVALGAFIIILIRSKVAYNLSKLRSRFSPDAVLEIYYRDLLGQLNMLGWQRHPADTIMVFTQRMGAYLPRQARQLKELSTAVCAWRYGGQPPQEASLINAAYLHECLEDMLRRQLKSAGYYGYRLRHWPKAFLGKAT